MNDYNIGDSIILFVVMLCMFILICLNISDITKLKDRIVILEKQSMVLKCALTNDKDKCLIELTTGSIQTHSYELTKEQYDRQMENQIKG